MSSNIDLGYSGALANGSNKGYYNEPAQSTLKWWTLGAHSVHTWCTHNAHISLSAYSQPVKFPPGSSIAGSLVIFDESMNIGC